MRVTKQVNVVFVFLKHKCNEYFTLKACTGGSRHKCASFEVIREHDMLNEHILSSFSVSVHRAGTSPHPKWRELSPLGTTSLPLAYQPVSASCAQHSTTEHVRIAHRPRHAMLGELNATLTILPDSVRFGEEKFTCSGTQAG